jgi:anaerobic ribonucleoside-triphosphate reductase activating protein
MSEFEIAPDVILLVAQIVPCTEAEGPGRRFALWFQGCPLRCPGCCNPEMLPFAGGETMTLAAVVELLRQTHVENDLEGITLLGGEPTAHALGATALSSAAHEMELDVMVFTGYTIEEIRARGEPEVLAFLAEIDMLIDGPYLRDQPEEERRWIGSRNQRILYLSDRCDPADPRWLQPNTLEIRLRGRELSVNGFPARSAVGLWKRPRKGTIELPLAAEDTEK